MKIYACAVSVGNERGQLDVYPIALLANSKREAIGRALELAHEESPVNKGNHNHQVTVVEIPENWYRR